jgi:septum formation protein
VTAAPPLPPPAPALVLASASPQRRAILSQVGIPFTVRVTGVAELAVGDPLEVAAENARRKATALPAPGSLVLGGDTVVAIDGDVLGKPSGRAQARAYLERLAGREHRVCGGVALARDGRVVASAVEVTRVRFRALDERWIDWYVDTGEWSERAGGYAIQGIGAALVAGIEGDYLNVVGLPLARLLELAPELLGPGRG